MLQELKQFWLVAQAAYARWGYLKNRNSSLLLCHLTLLSFPFAACQNLVLNPGVSSPLEHISVARWLTNLLWCTFSPVQIPQFKGWSEKQETKHNSSYKSKLPERIHSSTGSAGLAVESINKTEVDRYSSYLKWSGFKQEIALFPETLSEIKLPSDIHPAAKKSQMKISNCKWKQILLFIHSCEIPSALPLNTYKSVLRDFKCSSRVKIKKISKLQLKC